MKERFLDVIKWGLILVIAGAVFYKIFALTYSNMYPKFEFFEGNKELQWYRCNKITGEVEQWQSPEINMEYGEWESLGPLSEEERLKHLKAERKLFGDEVDLSLNWKKTTRMTCWRRILSR